MNEAPDIELALAACLCQFPATALPAFTERGRPEFFSNPVLRDLTAQAQMFFVEHRYLELTLFTQHLIDTNRLAAFGGAAFITSLWTSNVVPDMLDHYLDTLRDKFTLRQLAATASLVLEQAQDPSADPDAIITLTRHRITVLEAQRTTAGRLPALSDMSAMLNGSMPPAPPQIVETVLHQGSKLIVGGTSKGRKTYSLLDLAISVATGSPWWGFPTFKGPVCYINFEIQESFFCQRVSDILKARNLALDPTAFYAWNLRGHSEGIENLTTEIIDRLLSHSFALTVVDPIYKALGNRDENKAGDVASMLNQLERVAVQTGSAIAFGAHYSKGNQAAKEHIDRIGGSGVFARDPDSILTMTAHDQPDCFTVDATLRNFRPLPPFVLKWDWPLFIRCDGLDPEELKQAKPRSNSGQFTPKYSKTDFLDQLSVLDGIRPAKLFKQLSEMQGISRAQFYRRALELRNEGSLIEKDGLWFRKYS